MTTPARGGPSRTAHGGATGGAADSASSLAALSASGSPSDGGGDAMAVGGCDCQLGPPGWTRAKATGAPTVPSRGLVAILPGSIGSGASASGGASTGRAARGMAATPRGAATTASTTGSIGSAGVACGGAIRRLVKAGTPGGAGTGARVRSRLAFAIASL